MKKLLTLLIIVLLVSINSITQNEGQEVNLRYYSIEEALAEGIEGGRVIEGPQGEISIIVEVSE